MCRRRCMMKNARYIPILNIWVKNSFLFEKKKLKVVPHHANSSLFLSLTLQLIITLDAANVHFVRVVDHVEWGLGRSNYGSRNGRNMSVLDMEGLNCFSAAPSDQHKSRTQSTLG